MKRILLTSLSVAMIALSSCGGGDEKSDDKSNKKAPSPESNARVVEITCECANEVLGDYQSADEIDETAQAQLKADYMECVSKYKEELQSMQINKNEVAKLMNESCPKAAEIMEELKKR